MNNEGTTRKQLAACGGGGQAAISKRDKDCLPPPCHSHPEDGEEPAQKQPDSCPAYTPPPTPGCKRLTPNPQTRPPIRFFHECQPPTATAQQRRHNRSGHTYLPPAARNAKALLQAIFERYAPPQPLDGPLEVKMIWSWLAGEDGWKITRPDLDNLLKLALDAATAAGWWHDDAQVVDLNFSKIYTPLAAGIYVIVLRKAVANSAVSPTEEAGR